MIYHIESLCHQGNYRKNNEDAISFGESKSNGTFWMLVADGMGGHNAGEVASNMLTKHVEKQWAILHKNTANVTFSKKDWQHWIAGQLNQANTDILSAANNNSALHGMGTTGVLIVIDKNQCHVGWVGDSRAYHYSNNILKQVTTDHTMIQVLLNKGAITALEAKNANTKNLLSQAIGVTEIIEVDTLSFSVKENDVIMLSTDGLHDFIEEADIKHFLASFSENTRICDAMVKKSLAQKSKDNLTVGVVGIEL